MFSDKTIIGLDIGSDSIKMVEIIHTKKGKQLETYGVAKHNLGLDGYWDSARLRQIGNIITEIMQAGSFSGVKTVMSVQSKDVYVTTMDFEASWNRKQIQEEIDKQAAYFLPYPPDEMRLSWSLIKNDPRITAYTGKQRVIINALPDFVIENSKNLLEHVNLDGAALENQTISQIRAGLTPDQGNTVLVDVGGKNTTFSIVVDGVLRSSSHVPIGTDKITEDLSKSLGVETSIAEFFKMDINLVNLFTLPKEVMENLTILKSELATFVELNRKVSQEPQKIVIVGGGVYSPGFVEFFKEFNTPVYVGNCLRRVLVTEDYKPYVYPIVSQLATALGLALREDI
jgi:type IV pilus assembly protein PilM